MSTPKKEWRCIRSEPGPDLKLFRTRFDYMKNPRNDLTEKMIILDSIDSANVTALTEDGRVIFVRQYRFGIRDFTVELPGGLVDAGEEKAAAVQRELREETGYTAPDWHPLGKIPSNPVFMDSYIHHWVATGARHTHSMDLDKGEDMEILFLPLDKVKTYLFEGYFQHPHTLSALLMFFRWYEGKTK